MGRLEQAYPAELVVVGVHSAKYPAEGDPRALRHAVHRLGIRHPVVNDPDYRIWDAYAVKAWPTLVFISPDGAVLGSHSGELAFDSLHALLGRLITEYERDAPLNRGPLAQRIDTEERSLSVLAYPEAVLAAPEHIVIADTGHHRILVATLDGEVVDLIGSGHPGLLDGPAESARFNAPRGLALNRTGTLYVADSENHSIRVIDRDERNVRTVAGTGEQAQRVVRRGSALSTPLSSPWDLAIDGQNLYIAMAGLHQLWLFDTASGEISVWAGTGHEAVRDGPREQAWLAQPMGIGLSGGTLYVACAEAQAVRSIDIAGGLVSTLVGGGLFAFGDRDGSGDDALLQHCQGIAARRGEVFVADTYNNKIKAIDASSRTIQTYCGSGEPGGLDGPVPHARLNGPSGLSVLDGILWVADTNNHAIRRIHLEEGRIGTFELHGQGIEVRRQW